MTSSDVGRGPTPQELRILQVLWSRGSSTVRQVHAELAAQSRTGYTTTLKLMQIMLDKGLLLRDASQHSHVYRPAIAQTRMQRRMLKDMLQRVYDGSVSRLVAQALATQRISASELDEMRELIERMQDKEP